MEQYLLYGMKEEKPHGRQAWGLDQILATGKRKNLARSSFDENLMIDAFAKYVADLSTIPIIHNNDLLTTVPDSFMPSDGYKIKRVSAECQVCFWNNYHKALAKRKKRGPALD